jgi:Carbohydrate esterase, sialic acid-specific acetylesterase
MLARWRNEIAGRWPLLLGEIGSLDPGRFPAQQQVRDAQASVAGDPRVRPVSTVDFADDGVHFTVAADRELGVRYAAAFLSNYQFPRHFGL